MNSDLNRRRFLCSSGLGLGGLAWAALRNEAVAAPHFAPKAKRIIYLFMHGGPSHVDTFDPKPALARDEGKKLPAGFVKGFLDPNANLLASPFAFNKHEQSGLDQQADPKLKGAPRERVQISGQEGGHR